MSPPLPITTPTAARGTATFNKNSDQYFTATSIFTVPFINYNTFQTMYINPHINIATHQKVCETAPLHVFAKDIMITCFSTMLTKKYITVLTF